MRDERRDDPAALAAELQAAQQQIRELRETLDAFHDRLRTVEGVKQDRRDNSVRNLQNTGRIAAMQEALRTARIAEPEPAAAERACVLAANRTWLDVDDATFLAEFVKSVPGLLDDYAAARTMDLLAHQEREGVRGSLLEIGVFYGRYFAVLLRSAARMHEPIAALDTFEVVAAPIVRTLMEPLAGGAKVSYLVQASRTVSARELQDVLGMKARFISIDGSHALADVLWDLGLAEGLLSGEGVVAVDDFLDPITPGVTEGLHCFFAEPRDLVPFAFAANKLFLCRPASAETYLTLFENAVIADRRDARSANFRASLPDLRKLVEQPLWGRRVLIVV